MTTRKEFIAAGAAMAAVPMSVSAATPVPSPAPSEAPIPKLAFDLAAFDAKLNRDVPHKHEFAAKLISSGDVLYATRNTLNAYKSIGVPLSDVSSAVVLYHDAIVLAMDDQIWTTHFMTIPAAMRKMQPEFAKDLETVIDPKKRGNPLLHKGTGSYDASIEGLVADGATFYVCNNALTGFAQGLAQLHKMHPLDVYNELTSHLVANATIVPAGVWAVQYIQEKKYTVLQAS